MAIETTREKITPAKATLWLEQYNLDNRKMREGVAEQYAADMAAGRWTNCTQSIAFYDDGNLADGQHRLWAIVEADVTIEFNVMRGLKREDGLNIDTGLNRRLVDNGRISGLDVNLTPSIVSTARAVATGMGSTGERLSNAQRLLIVEEHREAAEWVNSKMPHTKNICNSVTMGAVARAWYWEADKDRLERFCKVMASGFGDGSKDSAAIAIRNYLLLHAGTAAGSSMWRDTFLKVQNAIQYFMQGKPLTVVRSVKDEAYPLKKKRNIKKAA